MGTGTNEWLAGPREQARCVACGSRSPLMPVAAKWMPSFTGGDEPIDIIWVDERDFRLYSIYNDEIGEDTNMECK